MTPAAAPEPAADTGDGDGDADRDGGAGDPPGAGLRKASWSGTVLFTVTSVAAVAVPALEPVFFVVAIVAFVAGCGLFFAAFARGVGRSRTEQVAVPSLFLMAGSAPRNVRRSMLGSLAVEVAVALAVSIARPYTILATSALVPMYALGLCGLWSARHGRFPRRPSGRGRPG